MDAIYRDAMPDIFAICDYEPWDLLVTVQSEPEDKDDVD